jgi:putative ABC transport system permease protein
MAPSSSGAAAGCAPGALRVGIQRRRELGVFGAVGLGPARLATMTLTEAAVVGLIGSLLGAAGGVAVFWALINVSTLIIGVAPPFRVDLTTPVVYAVVACGVVLVGAALPAWRTARLPIVEALQYE